MGDNHNQNGACFHLSMKSTKLIDIVDRPIVGMMQEL